MARRTVDSKMLSLYLDWFYMCMRYMCMRYMCMRYMCMRYMCIALALARPHGDRVRRSTEAIDRIARVQAS